MVRVVKQRVMFDQCSVFVPIVVIDVFVFCLIKLNDTVVDELGRWCLKIGGAGE